MSQGNIQEMTCPIEKQVISYYPKYISKFVPDNNIVTLKFKFNHKLII